VRKIPTLFRRDPDDMRRVLPEVHPDCQWVLDGEGVATRKWDGTCVMYDGQRWWARREVKPGKTLPPGFVEAEHDEVTGKTVGWEPAEQSSFWKYLREAAAHQPIGAGFTAETYELVGPKINGNPDGWDHHELVCHSLSIQHHDAPRDFEGLRRYLNDFPGEGIVWHHPDGRMAKLKRKDLGH
jgi:hypothetical protein